MKANYIVKNGERQTGEMSVFEAVEVAGNIKALSAEEDKIEIHSFCRHWGLKKNTKVNQQLIFSSKKEADEKWWEIKPDGFEDSLEVVEVREFEIWYRLHGEKDFMHFYTDTANLADAIDEAIGFLKPSSFTVVYEGEIVSRWSVNFVSNPEKRK